MAGAGSAARMAAMRRAARADTVTGRDVSTVIGRTWVLGVWGDAIYVSFPMASEKGPSAAAQTPQNPQGNPPGHLIGPAFAAPLGLAPYATKPADSRGRLFPEAESATRTCYSRD